MTEGYSGRELERFCKEVTTTMVAEQNRELSTLVDKGLKAAREYQIQIRPLVKSDFLSAASHIHPATSAEEMEKYKRWKETAEEE
jgi:SpoVK/Ycf46/Vps4 family AAA+-type ATPase